MNYIDQVARLLATENLSVIRGPFKTASMDLQNRAVRLPNWEGLTENTEQLMIVHETGHAKFTPLKMFEAKRFAANKHLHFYTNVVEDARIEKLMLREYPGAKKVMIEGYRDLEKRNFFGTKGKDVQKYSLINRINLHFKLGYGAGIQFSPQEQVFVDRCEKLETPEEAMQLAEDILAFTKEKAAQDLADQTGKSVEVTVKGKKKTMQPGEKGDGKSKSKSKSGDKGEDGEGSGDSKGEGKKDKDSDGKGKGKDKGDQEAEGGAGEGEGEGEEEGQGGAGAGEGEGGGDEEGEGQGGGGDCDSDSDEEGEDAEDGGGKKASIGGEGAIASEDFDKLMDDFLEASTQAAFDKALESTANLKDRFTYMDLDVQYTRDQIVPYKDIIHATNGMAYTVESNKSSFDVFKADSDRIVGYLIKEFELRKAADLTKRAQVSKTGVLDMRKISQYMLKDDIFKRITSLPEGKNHGMVFMIDWSGSMQDYLHQTIAQMINLVSFCRRMQIPFQVLAFSSAASTLALTSKTRGVTSNLPTGEGRFKLLELLSSDMSGNDFNKMIRRLYATKALTSCPGMSLGGTPLNESLLYMVDHLPKWQAKHMIQKLSFVCLTDGEGSSMPWGSTHYGYGGAQNHVIIRDKKTKKEYDGGGYSTQQTAEIIKMIQDRCGAKVIGFHLTTKGGLAGAVCTHAPSHPDQNRLAREGMAAFDKDGAYLLKEAQHDAMFLLDIRHLALGSGDVTKGIQNTDTADTVAKQLTANMKAATKSRMFLNKFIETMA